MSEADLSRMIQDIESDRIERTVSVDDTAKFSEAICAFANDFPGSRRPGFLLIGVDKGGRASGLKVTDQLLQNLGALRSDGNIQPLPALTVQRYTLPDGEVAVVEVLPSDLPPVRYKGRVFIRVGPRRAIASESEERILSERRTAQARSFDAQVCPDCGLSELSLDLFLVTYRSNAIAPEVLRENNRDIKLQLSSLRFYDLQRDAATYAGALLFAKDPLRFSPGAYIQFLRYSGTSLADQPLDEKRFSGDLLTVLRDLDAFCPMLIRTGLASTTGLRESPLVDVPLVAIRELLLNAVMHRTYESNAPIRFYWFADRVEIQSPGGLYGEATAENFPRQNSYRNPVIAEAMKALGFVNKYGRGVIRAQEALAANGNREAEFIFDPMYFLATLWRRM